MNKINQKLGIVEDTNIINSKSEGLTDPLSVTVEQSHGDLFLGNILDSGDDGLEDIFDESIEKLIEKPKITPSYCCYVEDCDQSDRKFPSNAELRRHQKETHRSLYCESCNTVSNSVADQLSHNCSKRHKCLVCARLFATANELLHHKYIHTGEKPHVCHICGKDFRQRATLDRHKITHDNKREHECQVCHKKFKHKHYLASHKLLHEGVKPHICSWCGLGFTQNSNLQKHVRQKHTQERAYVCTKCGKGFVQPYYLRRHLKSHKGAGAEVEEEEMEERARFDFLVGSEQSDQCGLRVVSCQLCSATCKGPAELEKHLAKHHSSL